MEVGKNEDTYALFDKTNEIFRYFKVHPNLLECQFFTNFIILPLIVV